MRLLIITILILTITNLFGIEKNDNILWVNPDCGDWETIDSLELGELEDNGFAIPYYNRISCLDSLNWASIVQNTSTSPLYFIFRTTTDAGKNWNTTYIDSGSWNNCSWPSFHRNRNCLLYLKNDLIIIGCDSGFIQKSIDGGFTWKYVRLPEESKYKSIDKIQFFKNLGFAQCLDGGLYKSEDAGESWTKVPFNPLPNIDKIVYFSMPDSNTIIVTSYSDTSWMYFASYDRGHHWEYLSQNTKKTSSSIIEPNFLTKDLGWGAVNFSVSEKTPQCLINIYKTTDGGRTWELNFSDPDTISTLVLPPVFSDSMHIIITSFQYIYYTDNGGSSWKKYYVRFNKQNIAYYFILPFFPVVDIPYFTLGPDMVKYVGNPSSVKMNEKSKVIKIYPNPTKDLLFINADCNEEIIGIYSILGIKVHESSNTNKINISNFPSGVYFIKIGNSVQKFVKL